MASINKFANARRVLLAWRIAKRQALTLAEQYLPKTHVVRKRINTICAGNSLSTFQCRADDTACKFADKYGDCLFSVELNGVKLQAPTDWFYGDTLHAAERESPLKITHGLRVNRISMSFLSHIHDLGVHARRFMAATRDLPGCDSWASEINRRLGTCERKFWRNYKHLIDVVHKLPVDQNTMLLCLHRAGLPADLGRETLSFIT